MAKALLPEEELDIPSAVRSLAHQFGGWELLGKKLGRSRAYLKKLAEGKITPSKEDIAKIKQLLGEPLTPVEKELAKAKPPGSGWEQIERDFGDLVDQFAQFKRSVIEALTGLRDEVKEALSERLEEIEEITAKGEKRIRECDERISKLEEIKREALQKLCRVDNRLDGYAERCEKLVQEGEKILEEIRTEGGYLRSFVERTWGKLIRLKIYTLAGLGGLTVSGILQLSHGFKLGILFAALGILGLIFVWRG